MKRSNFLKALFSIPLIPLVGNVKVEEKETTQTPERKGFNKDVYQNLIPQTTVEDFSIFMATVENTYIGDMIVDGDRHGYICHQKSHNKILIISTSDESDYGNWVNNHELACRKMEHAGASFMLAKRIEELVFAEGTPCHTKGIWAHIDEQTRKYLI